MTNTKTVLITGGSSGLGFGIAERYLKEGFQTIITGRNREKLEKAVENLGEGCTGMQFDMDSLDAMPAFVQKINDDFGSIDVLVNNAGINQKKSLIEVTDEDFQRIVMTNQTGLFALTREVVKIMLTQESRGSIVNISSMAAQYGIPKVVSYSASKTAVEGMTRAMAVELSPQGIRVNCVAPGFIITPMTSKALDNDPARKNKVISRTPMGKMGLPKDIADAVYFLSSDQASFITGETIKVDGGNAIGF